MGRDLAVIRRAPPSLHSCLWCSPLSILRPACPASQPLPASRSGQGSSSASGGRRRQSIRAHSAPSPAAAAAASLQHPAACASWLHPPAQLPLPCRPLPPVFTPATPRCCTRLPQVIPCTKRFVHDWTICPFAHAGEKAVRRDPRLHNYTGIACPDMKKVGAGCWCWGAAAESIVNRGGWLGGRCLRAGGIAGAPASLLTWVWRVWGAARGAGSISEAALVGMASVRAPGQPYRSNCAPVPARVPTTRLCPLTPLQTGSCIRGEKCPYAHNVFE